MCVCVCVCGVHVCVCMHVCECDMYMCVCTCMCVRLCACVCVYVVCMCACVRAHTCKCRFFILFFFYFTDERTDGCIYASLPHGCFGRTLCAQMSCSYISDSCSPSHNIPDVTALVMLNDLHSLCVSIMSCLLHLSEFHIQGYS